MFRLYIIALVLTLNSVLTAQLPNKGDPNWWKHGVFYQIYPRSFKDDNNDGIGDLKGIIEKLDHVKDAGVTSTWLSPVYASPQVDQGYDISDYRVIDPDYGTLEDLKLLLKKARKLGVKIIMDLVPNHTSDKHKWFIASVNGTEKYRDYYVWNDGKLNETTGEREPPNNWMGIFSNSTWTWCEPRKQFYLHQFTKAQPDLNFRNPAVVEEINDLIRFWLDFGIDGFRVDAVPFLVEDDQYRDEPWSGRTDVPNTDYGYLNHIYTFDMPETFELIYTWREVVDNYTREHGGDARILMTEAYTDIDHTMLYYGSKDGKRPGAHFTFNFKMITDININSPAADYVKTIKTWLENIPDKYISNWVFGNHDQHRVATRLGPQNVDGNNMLMALLPGIGVTYNGEEIGQENGEVKYEEGKDPGARDPKEFAWRSRDFERTPFQWDNSTNAGFNKGFKPWLPVSAKKNLTNLAFQNVPRLRSHYNIYKNLMTFRQNNVVSKGSTEVHAVSSVIVLKRTFKNSDVLLLFNIDENDVDVNVKEYVLVETLEVAIASVNSTRNVGDRIRTNESVILSGHEAIVLKSEGV